MARVSIPKEQNGGAPLPKNSNIILMKLSDLDLAVFPARDALGIKIITDFVVTGEAALGLQVTAKTISRNDNSDGDTDAKGWIQNLAFDHPGDNVDVNEFLAEWLNEEIIAISRDCGDGEGTRMHGTPCNPLEMSVEEQDNAEGVKKTITLTSSQRGKYKSAHFSGAIPALAADGSGGGGI